MMTKAREIIRALGGASRVAERLNLPRTTVQNWTWRGISARSLPALEALAREDGKPDLPIADAVPTLRRAEPARAA